MKRIKITNKHKGLTLGQLRAAITWVLRELGIEPAHAARWHVGAIYTGRKYKGWSGTAYGCYTVLRFTSRPLLAVERARDVVGAAAHELWHLEQFRRGLWGPGAARTATGKRKSVERGAELARHAVEAAFDAQAAELAARWGFTDPAQASTPATTPELAAALAAEEHAHRERQRIGALLPEHVEGCPFCAKGECAEFDHLRASMAEASGAWKAARRRVAMERSRPARVIALDKARAARAKQAEAREENARAKLVEWERKLAAARRKVAEWRARVRYYDRKAEAMDAAAGAAPPAGA